MEAWTPAPFNLEKDPTLQATIKIDSDSEFKGNFPRAAKWSPDGSVILAQCENRTFQLFDYSSGSQGDSLALDVNRGRTLSQASPILDFIWFPTASPYDPASFCFVASVRECPVKLLDASDGRLRASYTIVDHRERQIAPHSLAFNLTAQRLYCGFENAIEVFDVSQPGEGTRIYTTPSKKSKDGLKGIISSLAFSPSYGSDGSYFAAGTFTSSQNNVALFSDTQDEPLMYLGGGPRAGITQLQFNPMKPHVLYAAYRGSGTGSIYGWDIRSKVDFPIEVFRTSASSAGKTNQKLKFDVDLTGRMLTVGDQVGNISIFLIDDANTANQLDNGRPNPIIRIPALDFKANNDAIGSVAFHPYKPAILSASGSRHFFDSDTDSDDESARQSPATQQNVVRPSWTQPVVLDSSINIWDFRMGESSTND